MVPLKLTIHPLLELQMSKQTGSLWGWDDDDKGMGMDIQALLSEFGDFGDFFENDALPFGEPPGTAESQALVFSAPESGDVGSSPGISMMDVSDQMLLPVGFPSFDNFTPLPPPAAMEDSASKNQEATKNASASGPMNFTTPSSGGEFDHLIKSEARMTFAPEFGAVETPRGEISSSIFRSPYIPKYCKVDTASSSNNYVYSATPPSSPCFDGFEEKSVMAVKMKPCTERHDTSALLKSKKYYTHVERGKETNDGRLPGRNNSIAKGETEVESSQFSVLHPTNVVKSVSDKVKEGPSREDNFRPSSKTVLATEIECLACQASMCRLWHTLLSSSNTLPAGFSGSSGASILNQPYSDPSIMMDNISIKSEVKKKEMIPVRIAGDLDGGMLDGPLNAPLGVWRSVGVFKVTKTNTPSMEIGPSVPQNSFIEESCSLMD